ncbi:hypothetical protein F5887DRAFT_1070130 [Amanita rubescens]|nr:hypothetical protein F5887DRAFT_1070130 [Amanita rubescens]
MPSSGKHNKEEEEDEVYHVGMELPLSVCGVFNLRIPEVITKARVVAATDSSSGEEDGGSVSRKKKKKDGGARWEYLVKKTKKSSASVTRSPAAKGKAKVDIELTSSSDSGDDIPLSQVIPSKRKSIQITSSDEESRPKSVSTSKAPKIGPTSRRVTLREPVQDQDPKAESHLFTPSPTEISTPKPLPPPRVQPIPLPVPDEKNATFRKAIQAALMTKQRLAHTALNPVVPKNSTVPMLSPIGFDKTKPPSAASTKHTLTSLTFKKGPSTGQGSQTSFSLPESIPAQLFPAGPFPLDQKRPITVQEKFHYEDQSYATPMEVDTFLQSFMPQELAAPLTASPEIDQGPAPPRSLLTKKPPPIKIPKKWKWSGPLVLENSGGRNEIINVAFQDCTEPTAIGLRFSIVMTGVEQLVAQSFHDFVDISSFLRACQPPSQHGRISSQDDGDATILTLSMFMGRKRQVILIPTTLDDDIVGWLLLFSPDSELSRKFNIPPNLRQPRSLVVSLIPWELSAKQRALDWRKPISDVLPRTNSIAQTIDESGRWERSIRTKVSYHHALRVLKFPKALHEFMTQGNGRPFCICLSWNSAEQETLGLNRLQELSSVHVGALNNVHKMPQFLDRRANHALVQFYTYGTHESVAPSIWGVREIWPCGGVITFMPQAALDDYPDLIHRIRQTYSHPFWTAYVIPSALGMIARMICGQDDPLAVFDRGEFLFSELLTAIADGELAMLTAPRNEPHPTSATELTQQWIDEYVLCQPDSEREILQYAIASFNGGYSNIQPSNWMRVIAEEISNDLLCMQIQPAFMRDYRRYVVLRGSRQEISLPDAFEWVTTSEFDFRDDFFPRQ